MCMLCRGLCLEYAIVLGRGINGSQNILILALRTWICYLILLHLWRSGDGQAVFSVSEEANPGTPVGNLAKELNLNSVSAELVLQKALDREKQSVIQLTLTAVDGGKPPRSGSMTIVINVLDVNDNIPVFSKSLYKARINENAFPGTSVITVHASDLDEGVNGEIVYAFVNHDNDKNINAFLINPENGEIVVNGNLDYEKKNAVELRVQAKDKGHSPRAALCKVLVEIIDINDNIPEISVTSLINPIKEDTPVDTMVGMITVIDNDAGKNGQVSTNIIGSVPFKIQKSYKNYYTLLVNVPLDRESASQYNITIIATDEGIPPLSSRTIITVHVSDVNDNPPRFQEPVINVYVKENSQIGAAIHTVSAFDPDVGDNQIGSIFYFDFAITPVDVLYTARK
uniref:Protocadherin 2 alpha b 10 n=1 Tax=Astyanax mexicanus TaxID=7994 RepID=A0A8B9GN78_ASTMX